jgi:hypothetical protein
MNNKLNKNERAWLGLVKEQPCSVCGLEGPSQAHHWKQGQQFTAIALCPSCHTGKLGIHGEKIAWRIAKMTELEALNVTIRNVFYEIKGYGRHED